MNIETFGNNVIFKFVDDSTSKRFINSTSSGIIIPTQDGTQAQVPRWGKVTHVGPKTSEVKVDDYILIEAGMWTPGFLLEEQRYWKTDEECIICASDQPSSTY